MGERERKVIKKEGGREEERKGGNYGGEGEERVSER